METESRPAKVGERIKIINAVPALTQRYKDGDVLTVRRANVFSGGDVYVEGIGDYIDYREYEVVVEGVNGGVAEGTNEAPAGTLNLADKPLVFVQNEGYNEFDVYHRGKLVSGIRKIMIDADISEYTTHEIEYISSKVEETEGDERND